MKDFAVAVSRLRALSRSLTSDPAAALTALLLAVSEACADEGVDVAEALRAAECESRFQRERRCS